VARSLWSLYLATVAVVTAGYLAGPLNAGPVFTVVGASAVVAILVGAAKGPRESRLPWLWFAAGQALFVSGDVLAYNYTRLFGGELPFPSIADPLYLGVYPSLVAGLLLIIRRRSPGRDRLSLIDALIVTVGVGTGVGVGLGVGLDGGGGAQTVGLAAQRAATRRSSSATRDSRSVASALFAGGTTSASASRLATIGVRRSRG